MEKNHSIISEFDCTFICTHIMKKYNVQKGICLLVWGPLHPVRWEQCTFTTCEAICHCCHKRWVRAQTILIGPWVINRRQIDSMPDDPDISTDSSRHVHVFGDHSLPFSVPNSNTARVVMVYTYVDPTSQTSVLCRYDVNPGLLARIIVSHLYLCSLKPI